MILARDNESLRDIARALAIDGGALPGSTRASSRAAAPPR